MSGSQGLIKGQKSFILCMLLYNPFLNFMMLLKFVNSQLGFSRRGDVSIGACVESAW